MTYQTDRAVRLSRMMGAPLRAGLLAGVSGMSLVSSPAHAGNLPVPCVANSCGPNVTGWLGQGKASLTSSGNQTTVTQTSQSALLNWQSFNVSSGSTVTFAQPNTTAVAVNQIYQANPAQIFGSLKANGVVYLLNQNGILFGAGSQVNVGGLVASSLNISPAALANGIAYPSTQAGGGKASFQPYTDSNGNALPSGPVTVQAGATINSPSGEVLLFAPNVTNQGVINTPDGQTILGAGQRVFLGASGNSNLRGLLIEVGGEGTATNLGQIIAERGNVTLAGLAVNQDGLVSATTTVSENGSIVLQAQSNSQQALASPGVFGGGDTNGTVTLGSGSVTQVTLEGSSTDVNVAANTQPQSSVTATGATIDMLSQARITATAGNVSFDAKPGGNGSVSVDGPNSVGRIYLAPGSEIDVSGAQATLPMSDNELTVYLTSTELGNFPQQKNGPLFEQYITVDLRDYGTRSDGSSWIGTPLADLSSDVSAIQENVYQRSVNAGSITLNGQQSVLVSSGATLNVAGGQINYQGGYINPTYLLSATGQIVPIADANPSQSYLGTVQSLLTGDSRWAALIPLMMNGINPKGQLEAGYVQGANAGAVSIVAPVTALDGTINGATVRGPLQTIPVSAATAGAPTFNQIPQGASLAIGDPADIGAALGQPGNPDPLSVTFASGSVLDQLSGSNSGAFNPLTDPLPTNLVTLINPDILGSNGVTQLTVVANSGILLPANTTLAPGAGGSILLAGGQVGIYGTINVPSGTITLESTDTGSVGPSHGSVPSLSLGSDARLLAQGGWVNDSPTFGAPTAALYTAGGQITLTSNPGSLSLAAGSLIDVSSGAEETQAGSLVAGKGGTISISDSYVAGSIAQIDSTLRGFTVGSGSTLSISAPFICLSSQACAQPGAASSGGAQSTGAQSVSVQITPQTLTDAGFSSVKLFGNYYGLTVGSDVDLDVIQRNLVLSSAAAKAPTGTPMSSISTVQTLPAYARKPESLVLSTSNGGQQSYADLTISLGASLTFDPGASLTLSTDSRIFQNGMIVAPGGDVSLSISSDNKSGLIPSQDQGIWLGPNSVIDVSGTVVYTPDYLGLTTGTIYGGGNIDIDAESGYLFASSTSLLNASGYAAKLYVPSYNTPTTPYVQIDSDGQAGSISLTAAAGLYLGGQIEAHAAPVAGAAGGSLAVTLLGEADPAGQSAYIPQVAPTLSVTLTPSGAVPYVGEGEAAPETLLGQGVVPVSMLSKGGFDQLSLTVRNLQDLGNFGFQGGGQGIGVLSLQPGIQLSPAVSLVLDAPEILVKGSGTVNLSSSYVSLGSDDISSSLVDSTPQGGTATLNVSAQFIDLIGNFTLEGLASANLTSSSDIRGIGTLTPAATLPQGSLTMMGDLTLTAQQIYPATLSNYTVEVNDTPTQSSTLKIVGEPGTPDAVLSAGGALTLTATNIVDSGVLRAPIGTVTLNGTNVTLAAGSLIDVSADGLTIPFGETEGGLSWTYPINGETLIYGTGTGAIPLPQKQVSINASQLNFEKGATVNISGGGDLMAYEFTPVSSDTQDVLSQSVSQNTYAILPTLKLGFAPYDPLIYNGVSLTSYQSVYLSGGDGLAAGSYVLLPARYALLPGAYLVTAVSGYSNLPAGDQVAQNDGSVIVSGRFTYSGTNLGPTTQTQGFDVTKGSYAFEEAPYTTNSANLFFTAQSTSAGEVSSPLPQDAGIVAITAGVSLDLAGSLLANPDKNGRGGSLDLSATNLVVTDGVQPEPAGAVAVDASQIDELGVISVLLGGTRTYTSGLTKVTVQSDSVTVSSGATLTGPEILLAANDQIQIQAGATVQATGAAVAAGNPLSIVSGGSSGNGGSSATPALLRVSTGGQEELQSGSAGSSPGNSGSGSGTSQTNNTPTISVASGANVSAPGSVILSAADGIDLSGNLNAAGASVYLGSNDIALGNAPQQFAGTALQSGELAKLTGANLILNSQNDLKVFGPATLNLTQLTLQAPGLDAETSDAQLNLTTDVLNLQGTGPGTPTPAAVSGTLTVNAGSIQTSGVFQLNGFSQVSLSATKDLSLAGSGELTSSGNLALSAGVFQALGAYDYTFSAAGQITTSTPIAVAATAAAAPGGSYSFLANGGGIQLGGNFALPAGLIAAHAVAVGTQGGSVEVTSGAELNVAGQGLTFAGLEESSPGGRVNLQSDSGSVLIDSGATLDVSAGTGNGAGGAVSLTASSGAVTINGTLKGAGGTGALGGSLSVDAQSLNFSDLVGIVGSGGFTGGLAVHERGSGDLVLSAGQQIVSSQIGLTADGGSIDIAGTLNASGANGGQISLNAMNNVVIDGQLLATATANAARGGTVDLLSANGGVYVNSDATINVGGQSSAGAALQSTGEVWITAPRSSVLSVLNADTSTWQLVLAGNIQGASNVQIEGSKTYQDTTGTLTSLSSPINPTDTSDPLTDATAFMNSAAAITTALEGSRQLPIQVLPGIDIQSSGDLTIADTIDLSNVRFGSAPGVLTLQAAGNIYVNKSISDGFASATSSVLSTGPSWSYQITAGADLAGANPLGLEATIPTAGASVIVAGGTAAKGKGGVASPVMIRTGTGSIQIAAAQDLVLTNQNSVIYTAGEANGVATLPGTSLVYPVNGGSIDINVGRNVVGAISTELFTDWLWRTTPSTGKGSTTTPTAWTIAFADFAQGIGALGGGDLTVNAGGNINDLGAVVPSVGVPGVNGVVEGNHGILTVNAGGDVLGGKFLDMAGSATITAGGQIGAGSAQPGSDGNSYQLYPVLAMGDSQFAVQARSGITIGDVLDPTLLPVSSEEGTRLGSLVFGTYDNNSSMSLLSAGGDVIFAGQETAVQETSPGLWSSGTVADSLQSIPLRALPPNVNIVALGGDVDVEDSMDLWPSATGNLNLLAQGNINLTNNTNINGSPSLFINVSDADPVLSVPTPQAPLIEADLSILDENPNNTSAPPTTGFYAQQPLHGGAYAANGQADTVPARVVALDGNITVGITGGADAAIFVPKPIEVVAGGNIVNLGLAIEQYSASNISTISAGGDLTYPTSRINSGELSATPSEIEISGPGNLIVDVGGSVDLGTSSGIVSAGNLLDPALPAGGANIYVTAGVAPGASYTSFINDYLANGSLYDSALSSYMDTLTGQGDLTKAQALTAFDQLDSIEQQPLLEDILTAELRAGGRAAAAAGATHDNYTQAFNALEALFPGSNPTGTQTNPYSGGINLYFSEIYTKSAGNIGLFAPGGGIDVGLATQLSTFGINKDPDQLGIVTESTGSVTAVAYNSIEINTSRIVAGDGGNILLWSTDEDIDAGRGSKSAVSAPPPTFSITPSGIAIFTYPPAFTGSGIQALASSPGATAGDVDLFAPHGVVNASEAGIVAGNLTIAATAVLGTNNITVTGTSVGVPVAVSGIGVGSAAAASNSTAAAASALSSVNTSGATASNAPLAEAALSWLDVFVTGMGEEQCAASDVECLKRQQH